MSAEDRKFTLLGLSKTVHDLKDREGASTGDSNLQKIVDETRAYLIAYSGDNELVRRRHHEVLNRAVLGFTEERRLLMAMIQDYLLRRRLSQQHSPDGRYTSLAEAIFAEVIGLNVLELVVKNREALEEVQVVGTRIYEVRGGVSMPSSYSFRSIQEVERIQQNLVLFNQDNLHIRKRWAEVRLSDGARVTMTGFGFTAEPTLTIRFYTRELRSLEMLCEADNRTLDAEGVHLLRELVHRCLNLVIIGPTNSGKTQLLKSLVAEMPDHERLVTMETRFELFLERDFPQKNIVQYEINEDDPLHDGHQAFKLALRQSPKRIILAEIRDEDANLYVKACTRGHSGSMTTVHASQLEDVPDTIAEMCMMDNRPMNHDRLVQRITERVTQVGIEMALIQGHRRVVRIGQFHYDQGTIDVRTLYAYKPALDAWAIQSPLWTTA